MSAQPVDVLAVMGRMATASFVAADDHPESESLRRLQREAEIARAAVAELVEAVDAYRHTTERLLRDYPAGAAIPGHELDARRKERDRMFAAHARIGAQP